MASAPRAASAAALALALALGSFACKSSRPAPPPPAPTDAGAPPAREEAPDAGPGPLASAATWPRMRADKFGCLMERQLGVRDRRFNCSTKGYENHGDPCKETEVYYEGPAVPDSVVDRLDPRLTSIALEWEHGDLRLVTLIFDEVLPEAEARAAVGLPAKGQPLPGNVMSAKVEPCSKATTCVTLEGFEHQGAGDVDCPE